MIIQDIEPLTHRQALADGMGHFEATLQLMTGSSEVMAPPERATEVLQEVSAAWQSLNSTLTALLTDHATTVPALAAENLEVYNKLEKLTEIYVSAGIANGSSSDTRIDLLQRQEGLVYKMWKEALLTSQGMPEAAANLLESKALFQSTHRGILDGAEWLDIPKLSEVCALRAMTDVTYYFDQLSQLLAPISSEEPAQQRDTAAHLARNISDTSALLSSAMGNALKSFSSSCDAAQLTELQWFNVLDTAEDQLLQASQATQLFLQIALDYKVAESKVQLTLLSDDATVSLRNLLEGNKAAGLVAPPTQELSDQIVSVKEVWAAMRSEFTKAVFSDSIPIPTVSEIVRLTKLFTEQMEAVVSLLVRTSLAAETTLPSHTIHLASSQRALAQKIAKQATIINLGYSSQENWVEFNATRDLLVDTHWILLEGAPAAAPYPAVSATSNLCIIQQMWRAFDVYESLEIASEAVLRGERSLSQLETYISKFDREMGVAIEWYKSGGSGVLCDPFNLSLEYWKGLIDEVGRFRSLSQELSSTFLLVSLNMSTPEAITEGRAALDASAKRLRFGSKLVPPPPVQYLLDEIMTNLLPAIDRYHLAFEEDDVPAIFNQSSALLREADAFLQSFFVEAKAADVEAPLYRMDMASRQIALAQSIFSDYVRLHLSNSAVVTQSLSNSINAFEAVHQSLRHGGHGIEPLSLVRQDALKQWERIGESFSTFKAQLQSDAVGLGEVLGALGVLVAELEEGVRLFGIPDEEMRGEPLWPIIAYASMVLCMCFCGCAAIYAVRRRYAERAEWHLEYVDASHKV
eukprot:Skav212288  [mRNA]  locus=scaffold732:443133:445547:- [translate_table: standard]